MDGAGNVYAVDRSNDDIRKITPAGVVTTFAGTPGQIGSADGKGGAAQFYGPEELTVDGAGNIYVVEHFNNTVRQIAPDGTNWIVTTVAGCASCAAGTNDGTGIAARFNGPFGLTLDSSGNLYVADTGNKTIRKISPSQSEWVVTTFAGASLQGGSLDGSGTNARFASPVGLAANANGIYVADSSTIRKISFGGVVTTLAGCPTCAPGSSDGTGTNALFWGARGVAVDGAGNLYVMFTTTTQAQNAAALAAGKLSGAFSQVYMAVSSDHCQTFKNYTAFDGQKLGTNTVQFGDIFNALAIDGGGNLYAVAGGFVGTTPFPPVANLYVMSSKDHGKTWTKPFSFGPVGAHMLPAAFGGPKAGQLAVGFFHTTNGVADPNAGNAIWTYMAGVSTNATSATPSFRLTDVDRGAVYFQGAICTMGILCTSGRDLLDFTSATVDGAGCPLFTYAGEPVAGGKVFNYVTRQSAGCFPIR